MSSHRYKYLYQPVHLFFRTLSPARQTMLTLAKVALIIVLVGFQIATVNGLV